MTIDYNGALTREKFLFHEIRIVASLIQEGLSREEIYQKVEEENLFQFPTEKLIKRTVGTCFQRIDALDSEILVYHLATAPMTVAKQINLYSMMKQYRLVWDFMTRVIGEKYRTQEYEFSRKDLNVFFSRLQEQNDLIASWTDMTTSKLKQVLTRFLVECDYLDSRDSTQLNYIIIAPELEDEIRERHDLAALPAFNCFQ